MDFKKIEMLFEENLNFTVQKYPTNSENCTEAFELNGLLGL
jgi:hypothetical protein